jgi:hypothetical protein
MNPGANPPLSGMPGKISDYRLDGYIGRGRLSDVYRAHDEREDRVVAVKILVPALADDAAFRTRFLGESQVTGEVAHPGILPVYEVGDIGGLLYVAMHYAGGGDVRSLVRRAGPLPLARAWSIVAQVASALDAAHAHGLIHRNVKPSNILLDASSPGGQGLPGPPGGGEADQAYLSDFGMGSPTMPPGATPHTGQPAGTPDFDYVAPEQIAGQDIDGRADLYSLACTGYQLLCGRPPYGQEQGTAAMHAQLYSRPPTATALRPDLPAAVDLVLATALAKNPADRYPTCAEFARALQAALGLAAAGAHGSSPLPSQGTGGLPADTWSAYSEAGGVAAAGLHAPGPKPTQASGPVLVGPGGPQPPPGPPGAGQPGAGPVSEPAGPGEPFAGPGRPPPRPGNAAAGPPSRQGNAPAGPPSRQGNPATAPLPAVPGPDGPFPGPGGPFRGPLGPSSVPGQQFSGPGDPFPEASRLYREPGGQYPGQGSPFPGTNDPFDEPAGLYREPRGPYSGPDDPLDEYAGLYREPGSPAGPGHGGPYPMRGEAYRGPGGGYPQRPRSRGRALAIIGTVLAVIVVAVIAAVALSRKSAPPQAAPHRSKASAASSASPASGSAEAAAVNGLLSASGATRSSLVGAVNQVRRCTSVSAAVGQLQDVVNQRSNEVKQASALSTGALTSGATVKSDLITALRSSLASDRDYLAWAQQEKSQCKPGATTSAYDAAIGADSQSASAKQAFVAVWNPVAATYGLPKQSADSF